MKFKLTEVDKILKWLVAIILIISINHLVAGENTNWESQFIAPNVFWGAETNGIKVALFIDPLTSSNNIPIHCTPVIKSSIIRTNRLHTINVYLPPSGSCWQMSLKDGKANMVQKTDKGKLLGNPMTEPLMVKIGGLNMRAGYGMLPLIQDRSEPLSRIAFNLQDYFVITNSGRYQLTYEMRVILPQFSKTNHLDLYKSPPPTIILPPVVAEVEIEIK